MSRIRIAALVMCIAFAATLLAGCAGKSQPANPPPAGTPAADTTPSTEKVTLRFPSWQWGQPGYDEFFTAAIKEFQTKHSNVTIQKIPVSSADYVNTLVKMYAANDPPEINQFLTQLFYKAVDAGWYDQLDAQLARTDIPQKWAPYLTDAGKVGDKTYGVWVSGSPIALMYNKKMLADAGVAVPRTAQEFMDAAKRLTKKDASGQVTQYGYSITTKPDVNAYIYGLSRFIIGLGGGFGTGKQLTVNTPANKQAIEFERDLVKAGVAPVGADRIRAREIFWQGKAAMIIEGPWVMTSVKSENPSLLPDVGVAPMPFPVQTAGASNGFAIAKNQKYKDLAWEFIQMVCSQQWMEKYGEMAGVTPARQGALSAKAEKDFPWLDVFAQVEKTGKSYLVPGLESFENEIDQSLVNRSSDVFFGTKSADQALGEIQSDLQKLTRQQ